MSLTCSPLRPHLPYYHRLGQTHGVWDELECGFPSHSKMARPSLTLPYSCSASAASLTSKHDDASRLYTYAVTDLISRLPMGALEIPALGIEPFVSATSAVDARLVSPSASARALAIANVPARVHADRPFEIELAANGLGPCVDAAESVASWISDHALLQISVEVPGQPQGEASVYVEARSSGGGWILRALIRPAAWADAASVTVVSLSLAGQPVPCDCLPATLRVGYNHAPAPDGAVYQAAQAGDVVALQAALDAGGSTEEANNVRCYSRQGKGTGRAT